VERCDLEAETMSPNTFSILGYLSVLLWLAVPLLWILRHRFSTPGWLPLALALCAYLFATLNSRMHVSRIDAQAAENSSNPLEVAAAKRKALEDARSENVADIRFAEDGADDFIDKGGMDESEKKYLDHLQKKQRGESAAESNDLENLIDTEKPAEQLSTEALPEEKETRKPILMSEPHVTTARKLNKLNLNATYIALLLGISYFFLDYLTRANSYARAAYPLPFPAAWRNALTPLPPVVSRPATPRRDLPAELAHLVRQGDVFFCVTNQTISLPETLPRLSKNIASLDVLRTDNPLITPDFVFESLWFGRACFLANAAQAQHILPVLLEKLTQRKTSRARAKRNIHLVWNLPTPPDAAFLTTFNHLASATGFSLFLAPK
jgi:hypothetical protein